MSQWCPISCHISNSVFPLTTSIPWGSLGDPLGIPWGSKGPQAQVLSCTSPDDGWPMSGESTNHAKIELIVSFWMFSWGKQNVFYWLCTTDTWKSINIRTSANHWWDLIRRFQHGRGDEFSTRNTQNDRHLGPVWKTSCHTLGFFFPLAKVDPSISIYYSYIVCSSW
jgi:hypothetical protein